MGRVVEVKGMGRRAPLREGNNAEQGVGVAGRWQGDHKSGASAGRTLKKKSLQNELGECRRCTSM